MKKDLFSQGDVNFLRVDKIPSGVKKSNFDGVIQKGESTGHSHRIEVLEAAELYTMDGKMFLKVGENGVSIVHEEHAPVMLDPGNYEIHIDQSFDYSAQAFRNVAD